MPPNTQYRLILEKVNQTTQGIEWTDSIALIDAEKIEQVRMLLRQATELLADSLQKYEEP